MCVDRGQLECTYSQAKWHEGILSPVRGKEQKHEDALSWSLPTESSSLTPISDFQRLGLCQDS